MGWVWLLLKNVKLFIYFKLKKIHLDFLPHWPLWKVYIFINESCECFSPLATNVIENLWVVWIIYPKDKFIKKISHFLLCWCYNLLISWWMNQDLDGKFCRKNADILGVFRRRRRRRSGRLKNWRNNGRGRPWPSPSSTGPQTSWSWSAGRERRTSKLEPGPGRGD